MKRGLSGVILVCAVAMAWWLAAGVYMKSAGIVASGQVLAKREAFLLPGGDSWRHIFEITYQYRPRESANAETVVQRVDSSLYRSVSVGSAIRVRYSPSPFLRSFPGMGLYLEDASPLSRLHYGPPSREDMMMAGALIAAALVGFFAYMRMSLVVGGVAALLVGVCFPLFLLGACALVAFPTLFWASRNKPERGYGFALLALIGLSVAVLYWRMPKPVVLPSAAIHNGTAVIKQIRVVDELWSNTWETYSGRRAGEKIAPSFAMLDLEFTPDGAADSIRVLDRIDLTSLANVHEGSSVPIEYSATNPDLAKVAGGTHAYVWRTTLYLLLVAYGAGAIVTFLFVPIRRATMRIFHTLPVPGLFTDPSSAIARVREVKGHGYVATDDPRLRQLEEMVRARQARRGRT